MVKVISEKSQIIDGNFCVITQELSDGSTRKINRHGDKTVKIQNFAKKQQKY